MPGMGVAPGSEQIKRGKRVNLIIACPALCTFHPKKIGDSAAESLKLARESGAGVNVFMRKAAVILGHPVTNASVSRHFHHYREAINSAPLFQTMDQKLGDLEILDLVIQRGASNSLSWKPTIKDTIEAMKLKMQMTGNSAFDDLIDLFDGTEADDLIPEDPSAVLSEDELPSEDAEDLEDPLV